MRNCPFERMSDDPLDVISDPAVEAVMITAPTATHLDLVRATLAAGKPLFCEKPLAPTFGDVRTICDAVNSSGVTAQVGFHSRFHPIMNRLQRTVESGELGRAMGYTLRDDQYWPTGDVVPGHSSWRSDRAQAGGGALLEHSIHSADIVSWLFGPAVRVYARSRAVFGYDVEDVAAVTVEHESGVVGTILTIFNGVRGREERRFEVFFERGAVEATTDFIVGAAEDSYLVQQPDAEAASARSGRAARRSTSPPPGSTDAISSSTPTRPTGTGCGPCGEASRPSRASTTPCGPIDWSRRPTGRPPPSVAVDIGADFV